MSKSLTIKLLRHGESQSNTGEVDPTQVGDHRVKLTARGRRQARAAGKRIGKRFLTRRALIYRSPYERTRTTCDLALEGAEVHVDRDGIRIYEDPRLREINLGYHNAEAQLLMRRTHGWFYYKFEGGESPADCYDRACTFLESMMRQAGRKKAKRITIVSHGMFIRCFVMRFLHLTVEEFISLDNPDNCDVITIAPKSKLKAPQFTSGRWGVEGLRFRKP